MTTLNEYANEAMRTAIWPINKGMDYLAPALAAEAGEVAGEWAKAVRDDGGVVTPDRRKAMLKEAGDSLWMIAGLARELGSDLETIAQMNLTKLADRAARGVLQGSGNDR